MKTTQFEIVQLSLSAVCYVAIPHFTLSGPLDKGISRYGQTKIRGVAYTHDVLDSQLVCLFTFLIKSFKLLPNIGRRLIVSMEVIRAGGTSINESQHTE